MASQDIFDIFGTKIEPGCVITYAGRQKSIQVLRFAVVLSIGSSWHPTRRIVAKSIDESTLESGRFKLREAHHISPTQVWVIEDYSILPNGIGIYLQAEYKKSLKHEIPEDTKLYEKIKKDMLNA